MQRGIRRGFPHALIDTCPVADGGEGTAKVLAEATAARPHAIPVCGPLGETVYALFYRGDEPRVAILDMASAAGLMLVEPSRRNVMRSTTYGVGELLLAACGTGAPRVVIGVGGSAGNDGGCGMAQAIGVRFLDASRASIPAPMGGEDLLSIAAIDISGIDPRIATTEFVVVCDVGNLLCGKRGAAPVYAAQKGATESQIAALDRGLANLANIVSRDLGIDMTGPRCGAAGGLAAGLLAFAAAKLESGIDIVLDAVNFDARVKNCDLCLTGEGKLDSQSLEGKACLGVARHAAQQNVPAIALVGSVAAGAEKMLQAGLTAYELIGKGLSMIESIRRAEELIADTAERVVTRFHEVKT